MNLHTILRVLPQQTSFGLLGVCLWFSALCHAQEADVQRYTPDVPTAEPGELIQLFPDETAVEPSSVVLVEQLQALILFDDVDELKSKKKVTVSGVDLSEMALRDLTELGNSLEHYIGKPITLALLEEINQIIVQYFREHDRPIVDVFAPEGQEISDGVVRIIVLFGKRGDVLVEGATEKTQRLIKRQVKIAAGDVLQESKLRTELDWFNQNPFRNVNLIMQRGDEFGETDLVFEVNERRPYRIYGGLEDSGTGLTEKQRWFSGINWGDAFGLGHQLNYQFTSAFDIDVLNAHSLSYLLPLPWRHNLEFFAAYVDTEPDLSAPGFSLEGESWQLGFRYRIPLNYFYDIRHDVELGYDFKRSNNNLEFGAVSVFDTFTTVSQFVVGYNAERADSLGATRGGLKLFISPGDMWSDNDDLAFSQARARSSSDYMTLRLNLDRITQLPKNLSWYSQFSLQLTNENLIGSEQLGLGGYQSVRGYDDYQVVGDKGFVWRNELRSPEVSLAKYFGEQNITDQFQALVFIDYGIASIQKPLPGEETISLLSAGFGFRYNIFPYLTARLDYGWQLKEIVSGNDQDNRVHLGLVLSY